jgi:hypothetical protein
MLKSKVDFGLKSIIVLSLLVNCFPSPKMIYSLKVICEISPVLIENDLQKTNLEHFCTQKVKVPFYKKKMFHKNLMWQILPRTNVSNLIVIHRSLREK